MITYLVSLIYILLYYRLGSTSLGRKKVYLLILVMYLTGCGSESEVEPIEKPGVMVSPSLNPYVNSFLANCSFYKKRDCFPELNRKLTSILMVERLEYPDAVGLFYPERPWGRIQIEWNFCTHNPATCEIIMFHEIGHAYFLSHTTTGIMRSSVYNESDYRDLAFRTELIKEFFSLIK